MTPCDFVLKVSGSLTPTFEAPWGDLQTRKCGRRAVCFYVVHAPADPVFMAGRVVMKLVCRCADHAMPGPGKWMTEEEASVVMVHDS